jgi:hypothetical protein
MEPENWCRMYEYAMRGVDLEREERAARVNAHGTRRPTRKR